MKNARLYVIKIRIFIIRQIFCCKKNYYFEWIIPAFHLFIYEIEI